MNVVKIGVKKVSESMVMPTLKIDPEFQNKIPPLTDKQFAYLEENILEAGEVTEPIAVWNGVIVDGHHRYKIIQKHPEVKWRVMEMEFPDKYAAFSWMFKHQLGRRNLTEQQWTTMVGELTMARQHTHGAEPGGRGNQYTKVVSGQNGALPNGEERTRDVIAKELGIAPRTVDRAVSYAKGISAIREHEPETADAILKGQTSVKKKDVMDIAKAKEEERAELIKELTERKNAHCKQKKKRPREAIGGTAEYKELSKKTTETIRELYDTEAESEYTIEMLLIAIKADAERYIETLKSNVRSHKDLLTDIANRDAVTSTIQEHIIIEIEKIKEGIENAE